jgi:hypothetical protein
VVYMSIEITRSYLPIRDQSFDKPKKRGMFYQIYFKEILFCVKVKSSGLTNPKAMDLSSRTAVMMFSFITAQFSHLDSSP